MCNNSNKIRGKMNKKATIGTTVIIKDKKGKRYAFTLVSPGQIDLSKKKISVESPLGKALLNRGEGKKVVLKAPKGFRRIKICKIIPCYLALFIL